MAYEQSAYKRTMPKEEGFVAPSFKKSGAQILSDWNTAKGNTGRFNIPLGGGGGKGSKFAEEDYERQKLLDRLVWERSTPDVTGVGGQVRWDRDNNMVTSTLSPEMQAIYDEFYRRQGVFGDQATSLAGGGWEDAQKKRFEQMRSVYTDIDELAAQKQREREFATGATETQKYWNKRASSDVIDQRELGMLNQAFLESQGLIDSNLARQFGDIKMMTGVGDIANSMVKMPQPYPVGNLPGMSDSSTAWADLKALEDAKKTKGRSDMWNSILGGGSSLFT